MIADFYDAETFVQMSKGLLIVAWEGLLGTIYDSSSVSNFLSLYCQVKTEWSHLRKDKPSFCHLFAIHRIQLISFVPSLSYSFCLGILCHPSKTTQSKRRRLFTGSSRRRVFSRSVVKWKERRYGWARSKKRLFTLFKLSLKCVSACKRWASWKRHSF